MGTERTLLTTEKVDAWYDKFRKYIFSDDDVKGKGAEIMGDPSRIFICDECGYLVWSI